STVSCFKCSSRRAYSSNEPNPQRFQRPPRRTSKSASASSIQLDLNRRARESSSARSGSSACCCSASASVSSTLVRDMRTIYHVWLRPEDAMSGQYAQSTAQAAIRQGRYDDAIAEATRAIERDPADPEPLVERATALACLARHAEAAADL